MITKITFTLLLPIFLFAQSAVYVQQPAPFAVYDSSGSELQNPASGGFTSPRPQFVDIDADGDLDLFVQDRQPYIRFWENTGTTSQPLWLWRTDQFSDLDIGSWYRFADIDGDADQDLLCESPVALIKVYRNIGTAGVGVWELAADSLKDAAGEYITAEITNIPEVADFDCDGDVDIILAKQTGSITYFQNNGLADGLPVFEKISDSFQNISIVGDTCSANKFVNPDVLKKHGANGISLVDIDADGDQDLFWGDFFNCSLYFLRNEGNCSSPQLALFAADYPPFDPLHTGGYNFTQFADIDADGDPDMFTGVQGGLFSDSWDQVQNFFYFENTGESGSPTFVRRSEQFIQSVDHGEKSTIAFVDIDADDDPDLFIGNEAEPGMNSAKILHFYENRGTALAPEFWESPQGDILLRNGFNYAPAFADIDGDGDQDLFVGDFFGQLARYENNGTAGQPAFVFRESNILPVAVGQYFKPAFNDIDADGDLDLFGGTVDGSIHYFENRGSVDLADFVQNTSLTSGLNADAFCAVNFNDVDADGDQDLISGNAAGIIDWFENTGSETLPQFSAVPRQLARALPHATPAFADLTGDGNLDILSGTFAGGIQFFEYDGTANGIESDVPDLTLRSILITNYPNPFNGVTRIRFFLEHSAKRGKLDIYDTRGAKLFTRVLFNLAAGDHEIEWQPDATLHSSGVYITLLRIGESTASGKMLYLK